MHVGKMSLSSILTAVGTSPSSRSTVDVIHARHGMTRRRRRNGKVRRQWVYIENGADDKESAHAERRDKQRACEIELVDEEEGEEGGLGDAVDAHTEE
jgi:hypothetical protein